MINAVTGFSVNSDGSLTPLKQSNVPTGSSPVRAASDPQGKFLYVANQQSQNVSAFSIASDGTLTPVPGSPFGVAGPATDVTVDPTGKFVFVADGAQKNFNTQAISVFSIGSNGALTQVAGSPFATQNSPTNILTDPSGKYLYVASGPVEAFTVNQTTGALTPIPGSPFIVNGPASCPTCAGRTVAFNLAIDASGKHLYTADGWAGSVYAFDIDATTGTLTPVPGAPFVDRMPTGQSMDPAFNPYGLAIGAQGKFLYGYDSGDEDISYFSIDPTTGALGSVQKTVNTFGGVCAGQILRTDPSGKFLYGLGANGPGQCIGMPAVLVFGINQTNGTLSVISSGPSTSTTVIQAVPFNDGIAIVP